MIITEKELTAFKREFLLRVEEGISADFASDHYHSFMCEKGYIRRAADNSWMLTPLGAATASNEYLQLGGRIAKPTSQRIR